MILRTLIDTLFRRTWAKKTAIALNCTICLTILFGAFSAKITHAQADDTIPYLLKDIVTDATEFPTFSSYPDNFMRVNDAVIFRAKSHSDLLGIELFRTDGTDANTKRIAHLFTDATDNPFTDYIDLGLPSKGSDSTGNEWVYYTVIGNRTGVIRTDGTAAGTKFVDTVGETPLEIIVVEEKAYIVAVHDEVLKLWQVQHTETTSTFVTELAEPGNRDMRDMVYVNGAFYYTVASEPTLEFPESYIQLWRTDGTSAPVMLKDGRVLDLTVAGEQVYFMVDENGYALWRVTDGDASATATEFVHGFEPVVPSAELTDTGYGSTEQVAILVPFGDALHFYSVDYGDNPSVKLWRVENTASAPKLLATVSGHSSLVVLEQTDEAWFFAFTDMTSDDSGLFTFSTEVWQSDGTVDGTKVVGTLATTAGRAAIVGNHLFNLSNVFEGPQTLSVLNLMDGTYAHLAETYPTSNSEKQQLIALDDKVLFAAQMDKWGSELWSTTRVTDTTKLVRDINRDVFDSGPFNQRRPISSEPAEFIQVGEHLYFTALGASGRQLWRTDGTPAGTELFGTPELIADWKDVIYLAAERSATEVASRFVFTTVERNVNIDPDLFIIAEVYSIWVSDGTPENTRRVGEVAETKPNRLAILDDSLIYTIPGQFSDDVNRGVWGIDLTTDATTRLSAQGFFFEYGMDDTVTNSHYYFAVNPSDDINATYLLELWATDGTLDGTAKVASIGSASGSIPYFWDEFVTQENSLMFISRSVNTGCPIEDHVSIWQTIGTAQSTTRLHQLGCDETEFNPPSVEYLTATDTSLFFYQSTDFAREIWHTDLATSQTDLLYADANLVTHYGPALGSVTIGQKERIWTVQNSQCGSEGLLMLADVDSATLPAATVNTLPKSKGTYFVREQQLINDRLVFSVIHENNKIGLVDTELWQSDGDQCALPIMSMNTATIPNRPRDLIRLGNRLVFAGDDTRLGSELWAMEISDEPLTCQYNYMPVTPVGDLFPCE